MELVLVFMAAIVMVYGKPTNEFQENIDIVNIMQTTWTAGHNYGKYISMDYIKGLCGALDDSHLRKGLPGMIKIINILLE